MLTDASCSVLIVRAKARQRRPIRGDMSTLLATNGSPDARAAVAFLRGLGFRGASRLTVLHVIKKRMYQRARLLTTDRASRADFRKLAEDHFQTRGLQGVKLLEETRNELDRPGLRIIEDLAVGHESEEILKAAERVNADLVVVG